MNPITSSEPSEAISKSQRKRDMAALRDLGRELTEASATLLAKLTLPANLLEAIAEFKRLPNSHGAKKRQLQYIGKIMRDIDTEEIEKILEQSKNNVELQKRKFHDVENIRDQLLSGDSKVLDELISDCPDVDIQHVRQLVRQGRKEESEHRAPVAGRKLFRYLRETMDANQARK
ncbi:MAG: ribosome biogenesis factor YjgA [Pseudomonadales bacterium]|nr:ribosome biogenesis factor YjgA [Pseudomonadales bacterium]